MANGKFYTSEAEAQTSGVDITQRESVPGGGAEMGTGDSKIIYNPKGSSLNQAAQAAGFASAAEAKDQGYNLVDTYKAPSIVTSDKVKEKVDTGVKDLDTMTDQMGKTPEVKPTGDMQSQVDKYMAESPEAQVVADANAQIETTMNEYNSKLDEYKATMAENHQGIMDGIKASYDRRIKEMKVFNQNMLGGKQLRGVRSGRQRYAREMHADIISKEELAGFERITDLESMMQQELLAAQQAFDSNNLSLLAQQTETLTNLYNQKRQAALDLANLASDQERKIMDRARFNVEMTKFEDEQAERTANIMALNLVDIDEEGNIIQPEQSELERIAENQGVDVGLLKASINSRIDDISSRNMEERMSYIGLEKAYLELEKTKAEIASIAIGDDNDYLSPTEAATLGVAYGTTKGEARNQGILPKSTLNPQDKIDLEVKLSKQVYTNTQEARDAQRQINLMKSGFEQAKQNQFKGDSLNAASQAVLVTFQKILDPTSVVRESEYARSPSGLSLIGRMQGAITKLEQGGAGLTANQLKEFVDLGEQFLGNYNNSQLNDLKLSRTQAESYGLNLDNILTPDAINLLKQNDAKELQQWYSNNNDPELERRVESLLEQNPYISDYDLLKVLGAYSSFNQVGNTSASVSQIKDFSKVNTAFGEGTATGIEAGSKFWKYGYDLVLSGGKGTPVKTPFTGEVVSAKNDGAWGNSVKIKKPNGEIVRLSHLDSINVKPGQKISYGTIVGGQGNTGQTYGKTGIHLDITVYKPDGTPYSSQEVASMFNTKLS